MASKTEIANRIISKLGAERITDIDTENVKAAKVIRDLWDIERRALLMINPWNFSVTRTNIAADAASPDWGYDYQYALPSDFISLLELEEEIPYSVESDSSSGGMRILCDEAGPLYIKYIRDVTNAALFDPLFVSALSAKIAFEACEIITQSNTKKQILFEEYKKAISDALSVNAIQNAPQELQNWSWITSREGYSG